MYLRHFAFSRLPFADTIEVDLLFASAARQEAEVRLRHLLALRGTGRARGRRRDAGRRSPRGRRWSCRRRVHR